MIGLPRSVLDGCQNVLTLQAGIIFENFVEACARSQQAKNIADANSHASDARAASTLSGIVIPDA